MSILVLMDKFQTLPIIKIYRWCRRRGLLCSNWPISFCSSFRANAALMHQNEKSERKVPRGASFRPCSTKHKISSSRLKQSELLNPSCSKKNDFQRFSVYLSDIITFVKVVRSSPKTFRKYSFMQEKVADRKTKIPLRRASDFSQLLVI